VNSRPFALVLLLAVCAATRLAGQDSTVDRGVRIGITYRPGVRPGLVVLPVAAGPLDSVRAMVGRDLDFSDRFEVITLPGGDSLDPAPTPGSATAGRGRAAASVSGLNYSLYQALGADFAVQFRAGPGDSVVLVLHDVAAGAVRRTVAGRLPPAGDAGYRMAIHRLADQVVQASLGAPGTSATRILFVKDKHVWSVDQDGANLRLVSSATKEALSPAWSADGKRFAYMEFNGGHGQINLLDLSTGKRSVVYGSTGRYSDFTPAFSPDGKTMAFSRATEEGTDLWSVNYRDACCLQRLTVGKFSDNLSPTYSPDGRRVAFVSTRPGLAQIYVMGVDGTDQQLFAPFDYGVSGSSNAPDWSPDGLSVAFHRDVGGTLQVFVLDVRKGAVKQLTSLGRNEDPTWAPDSRHLAFVSDRAGYRQLWIIDLETGRIRPLLQQSGERLPAWSPRLPEAASATP
jgi:TolB protein